MITISQREKDWLNGEIRELTLLKKYQDEGYDGLRKGYLDTMLMIEACSDNPHLFWNYSSTIVAFFKEYWEIRKIQFAREPDKWGSAEYLDIIAQGLDALAVHRYALKYDPPVNEDNIGEMGDSLEDILTRFYDYEYLTFVKELVLAIPEEKRNEATRNRFIAKAIKEMLEDDETDLKEIYGIE